MMKQLLSALLVLSLVFQPIFAQSATPQTPQPKSESPVEVISIEDLLPADTLAYVATSNLASLQHSFQLLDAYKVTKARLPKEELDSGENPLNIVERFLSFGVEDSRALEGSRIGFALILLEIPEEIEAQKKAKAVDERMSRPSMPDPLAIVFLEGTHIEDARKAREQLITYFNDNFSQIGKLSDIKQFDYKGQKLDRFRDGQVGIWFGATYVISQQVAIDRLLNLREDRRAERLADDQEFLRSKTQMMPQTGLFAYLNGKPLNRLIGTALNGVADGAVRLGGLGSITSFLTGAEAIKSVAISETFDREGVIDRLQVNLDPAKKNLLTTLFAGPKIEFKAPQFVPAGTEILVSQSMDWVKVYDDVLVNMLFSSMASQEVMTKYYAEQEAKRKEAEANNQKPPEPNYEELQKRLATELTPEVVEKKAKEQEAKLNLELGFVIREELAKDFGNEITVAYDIPKLVFAAVDDEGKKKKEEGWAVFIGIKDRAATQQALIKTFGYFSGSAFSIINSGDEKNNQPKTEEQLRQERVTRYQNALSAWQMMPTEIYKNVEIKNLFALNVGFSDSFLMVADSKETIKQMLDLAENGRAISSDYNYSRAMNSVGSATTKVFIGPKLFDGLLNDFIKSWVANPSAMEIDPSMRAPLNIPATVAGGIEGDANSIKLEAFSPLGLAGTFALWGFGSDVKRDTERNETDARYRLQRLAKAEKAYAKKHLNRYATPEALSKIKSIGFNEGLQAEEGKYKFEFKIKPGNKGYEATATPIKYGRNGRLSFFVDESGTIRSADKQGAHATASDEEERTIDENSMSEAAAADETAAGGKGVPEVVPPPQPSRPIRRKR